MSAYVVSAAHIDYLLQAAMNLNRSSRVYYGQYDRTDATKVLTELDVSTAGRIGADLLRENIASVAYRYENCAIDDLPGPRPMPTPETYEYHQTRGKSFDPRAVMVAVQGYEYQSCEHVEWPRSDARAFCDRLYRDAADLLIGDEWNAYWDIDS